jgi:hypothetical protein
MNVRIEDQSTTQIRHLNRHVTKTLSVVPAEHLRGLTKIVFVDVITEPRIAASQRTSLPALYHPRMAGEAAWAEVATSVVLPKEKFHQRLAAKLALKPNLAQIVLSLIAQHYYLTLSKGIKKTQLETACRSYTEKYFEKWREAEGGIRMKLTKPIRPFLDRFAKKLSKKYRAELEKKRSKK